MFTGLIEQIGVITDVSSSKHGVRWSIEHPYLYELNLGDSMAINGVCLTITDLDERHFACDISPETLSKTNLNTLTVGCKVNLERALTPTKLLGGHIVLGHVDEVCSIKNIQSQSEFLEMTIRHLSKAHWLIEKGSIAVNGISLTINQILAPDTISCMLIPHTLEHTNLKDTKINDTVNIEYDYIAKIITRQQSLKNAGIQEGDNHYA